MARPATGDETLGPQIDSLDRKLSRLREKLPLQEASDALDQVVTALDELPFRVQNMRRRGYLFRSDLEARIESLSEGWPATQQQVQLEIQRRSRRLMSRALAIDGQLRQLELYRNRLASLAPPLLTQVEHGLDRLEEQVEAEVKVIEELFDTHVQQVREIGQQIGHMEWMLDQFATATFGLYQGEGTVEAVQAQQFLDGEGGPKGVLYLTDQRLLFEQKEEVVVKRRFLVFTEKETVHKLLWELPIGLVERAEEEKEGRFVFKKEYLELTFGPGAPLATARLRLGVDPEEWLALIGRVKSGEIVRERIDVEEVAAVPEEPLEIPAQCPGCGAALPQQVVRGQRVIVCEYCGREIGV